MADPAAAAPAPPRDPRSDVMPDYTAGAASDYIVGLAARLSITEDQAREFAVANWNFEHQRAVETWEAHQATVQEARRLEEEERQRLADEELRLREEEERQRQAEEALRLQEEAERRRENELRRELQARPAGLGQEESPSSPSSGLNAAQASAASTFVFPTIGPELVSTRTDYGITEYASTALRDPTKLVNFWYFTHAGREEARQLALASVAEDASTGLQGTLDPTTNTFSFTRVSAAGKPSRNALPDSPMPERYIERA